MEKIKLSVWGDSVLQGVIYDSAADKYIKSSGFVQKLSDELGIEIKNYSRFGLTTEKAKKLYQSAIEGDCGDALLIELGGNDCNYNWEEISARPKEEHSPVTSLIKYTDNLEEMIVKARKKNKKVLICTLTPLYSNSFFNFITRKGLSKDNILMWLGDVEHIYRHHERYNSAAVMLAKKYSLPLIDIRDAFLQNRNYRNLLCDDGMHPSFEGQKIMYGAFVNFYRKNYR